MAGAAAAEERRKRQAEALRANLRRRKAVRQDEAATPEGRGDRRNQIPES